eukprot:gnl/Dysnectes_brevis/5288_a7540_337.p1 GENE.gnl/Dysnectes_brevis/5288_a7540_337~~gnl/Dysnectes_brevis/5288_a7540_337.p1  ORF type:complete len:778 (+),score=79.52 gnl/Dysnectes_brevis/5288_a7540_337:63-2396(+)
MRCSHDIVIAASSICIKCHRKIQHNHLRDYIIDKDFKLSPKEYKSSQIARKQSIESANEYILFLDVDNTILEAITYRDFKTHTQGKPNQYHIWTSTERQEFIKDIDKTDPDQFFKRVRNVWDGVHDPVHSTDTQSVQPLHLISLGTQSHKMICRLRPGLFTFLQKVRYQYQYRIHIFTLGTAPYASVVRDIIDPGHTTIQDVRSREHSARHLSSTGASSASATLRGPSARGARPDESLFDDLRADSEHREGTGPEAGRRWYKDVEAVIGKCGDRFVILDDSSRPWTSLRPLIKAEAYKHAWGSESGGRRRRRVGKPVRQLVEPPMPSRGLVASLPSVAFNRPQPQPRHHRSQLKTFIRLLEDAKKHASGPAVFLDAARSAVLRGVEMWFPRRPLPTDERIALLEAFGGEWVAEMDSTVTHVMVDSPPVPALLKQWLVHRKDVMRMYQQGSSDSDAIQLHYYETSTPSVVTKHPAPLFVPQHWLYVSCWMWRRQQDIPFAKRQSRLLDKWTLEAMRPSHGCRIPPSPVPPGWWSAQRTRKTGSGSGDCWRSKNVVSSDSVVHVVDHRYGLEKEKLIQLGVLDSLEHPLVYIRTCDVDQRQYDTDFISVVESGVLKQHIVNWAKMITFEEDSDTPVVVTSLPDLFLDSWIELQPFGITGNEEACVHLVRSILEALLALANAGFEGCITPSSIHLYLRSGASPDLRISRVVSPVVEKVPAGLTSLLRYLLLSSPSEEGQSWEALLSLCDAESDASSIYQLMLAHPLLSSEDKSPLSSHLE